MVATCLASLARQDRGWDAGEPAVSCGRLV